MKNKWDLTVASIQSSYWFTKISIGIYELIFVDKEPGEQPGENQEATLLA